MSSGSNTNTNNLPKSEKPKRICASTVKSLYGLKPDDLDNIPYDLVSNPHYRCAPQMRLYDEFDVILYVSQINDPVSKKQKEIEHQQILQAKQQERLEQKNAKKRAEEEKAKDTLHKASQLYNHAKRMNSQMDKALNENDNENENEIEENNDLILPDLPDDILRKISGHLIDDVCYHGIYGPDMAAEDCASLLLSSKKLKNMAYTGYNRLYDKIIETTERYSYLIPKTAPYETELKSMLCGQDYDPSEKKTFTKKKLINIARDIGVTRYTVVNKDVLCVEILKQMFKQHLDSLWVNSSSLSSEIPFLLPYIILMISYTGVYARSSSDYNKYIRENPDEVCTIDIICTKLNINTYVGDTIFRGKEVRKTLFHVHGFKQELTYDIVDTKHKALEEERKRKENEQIKLMREESRLRKEKLDAERNEYYNSILTELEKGKVSKKKRGAYGQPICQDMHCNNTPSPFCTFHCCKSCCRHFKTYIMQIKATSSKENSQGNQGIQGIQGNRYPTCPRHM